MTKVLDGKQLSSLMKEKIKEQLSELKKKGEVPGLAVVIAGNDQASRVYVNMKKKSCEELGINSFEYAFDEKVTEEELLDLMHKLNNDEKVNGILIQSPLPSHIDEEKIILAVNPIKDVDGASPINIGRLIAGHALYVSCTPAGCMELIKHSGVEIAGKECVVIGRSNVVGKPMAMLLMAEDGTVTIAHSKTPNLKEVTKRADILVVSVGRANMITGDMIKPGAVVIDVGINRTEEGKLVGDVEYSSAYDVSGHITPVPGGVGPMTIAVLMKNTVDGFLNQRGLNK